jgi:hypothetical protein
MTFRIEDCRIRYENISDRAGKCTVHKRWSRECENEREKQIDLEFTIGQLISCLRESKSNFTPAIRRQLFEAMSLEYCEVDFNAEDRLWCSTHDELASHCAPNGDDNCCATYANNEGCSCCQGNRV